MAGRPRLYENAKHRRQCYDFRRGAAFAERLHAAGLQPGKIIVDVKPNPMTGQLEVRLILRRSETDLHIGGRTLAARIAKALGVTP